MQLLDFKENDGKDKAEPHTATEWFQKARAIEHAELKGNIIDTNSRPEPIRVEFRLYMHKTVVKGKIRFAAVCERKDEFSFPDWTQIDAIENIPIDDEARVIFNSWTTYLQSSFVPDNMPPATSKYPLIPEDDGITPEWLEQVIKIDPVVVPEITTFDKQNGYHVLYTKPEFPFPLATSTFNNIPALEEHIQTEACDSMIWDSLLVRWNPRAAQARYIYHKKYTSEELAACDPDTLKRIAHIKQIPKSVEGIGVIEKILNHQSANTNVRI
jgi:hypothetical protein